MCLKHKKELTWNGYCSFCASCYEEDTKYAMFVEEFSKKRWVKDTYAK